MAESGYGTCVYFCDFLGAEIPVANAVAYGTTAGGCNYYLGDLAVKGDLADTDSGVVALAKANGWARLTGTNEDGKGCAICTDPIFAPATNGPLALEVRVETQALTARNIFVGFCDAVVDDIAEPLQSVTVTHTLSASDLCGFNMNSLLTAGTAWHAVYNGGATTGQTVSTSTTTGVVAVAGVSQVLRVEIDPNGTARYYIDGKLESTVTGAVSTTVLQAAVVGVWGTTTTITDLDVDYIAIEYNRDWTV